MSPPKELGSSISPGSKEVGVNKYLYRYCPAKIEIYTSTPRDLSSPLPSIFMMATTDRSTLYQYQYQYIPAVSVPSVLHAVLVIQPFRNMPCCASYACYARQALASLLCRCSHFLLHFVSIAAGGLKSVLPAGPRVKVKLRLQSECSGRPVHVLY